MGNVPHTMVDQLVRGFLYFPAFNLESNMAPVNNHPTNIFCQILRKFHYIIYLGQSWKADNLVS